MDQLNKLTKTLNKVESISNKIIKKTLPIMKKLEDVNSELVDDLMRLVDDIGRQMALELLQDTVLYLIRDAETITKEINFFTESVIQGSEALDEGEDEYPFLMEVWLGDVYGVDGINGLEHLVKDLRQQSEKLDEEEIVSITAKQINGEE